MGFCRQCGADLQGANFCPNCGAAVNAVQVQQGGYMDLRQQSMAEMGKMLNYFTSKSKVYYDLDAVNAQIAELNEKSNGGWVVAAIISLAIAIFKKSAFFFVAAAVLTVLFVIRHKKTKDALSAAMRLQRKISKRMEMNYEAYGYCPVGLAYTRPEILMRLAEIIEDGRANTPGEAINIMKTDEKDAEILALQRQMAIDTAQIKKDAEKTATYVATDFWLGK